MLVKDDERLHEFNKIAIKDNKYDVFCDAFAEFIHELNCVDLSKETLQYLYDLFLKDMNIYFKNKKYENWKENNMSEEIAIDTLSRLIDRCKECKFATCENCEISWNEVQSIKGLLDLYNKEKEKREIAEENHKVLSLDLGQALKGLGLPEDTIIADELVLEINKKYISKDKVKEKIDFLKEVLAFAETGRDEKATIQANLLKNIIIEMKKLLEE